MKNYFQKNYTALILKRTKNITCKFCLLLTFSLLLLINRSQAQNDYQPFFQDSTILYKAQNIAFNWPVDQYQKSFYKAAAFDSVLITSGYDLLLSF